MNIDFAEYFALAQINALAERESLIVEMRFGFMGGEPHTLEEIAQHIGVSRERIRQILAKSYRKILGKGKRELKKGQVNEPCAALLSYVNQIIRPQDDNVAERLADFVENELLYLPVKTQALPLVAYLAFQKQQAIESYITQAHNIIKTRKYAQRKNYKQQILSEKFQDLLSLVIWPSAVKLLTADEIASFKRKREVSTNGEGHAGYFHSSKVNRVVQYESELEYNFLQRLEQLEQVIFYQEQPLKIFYEFGNQKLSYYPDVLFVLQDGKGVVVEIKPVFMMALRENLRKWIALKKFCAEKGLGLLITDGRYTIQQLQRHEVNPHFAKDVLLALQNGALSWPEYKRIRDRHDVNRNDFPALVLEHRLIWQLNPFMLSVAS